MSSNRINPTRRHVLTSVQRAGKTDCFGDDFMLNVLRRGSQKARLVRSLYAALMSQARQSAFFRNFGVADTIDGRFDMVALHAWLVLSSLRAAGLGAVASALLDTLFVGFDEALRDLGVGDMGMGRKIKQMGHALNGRLQVYEEAADEAALAQAILRNVFRGEPARREEALMLARYASAARSRLKSSDLQSGMLDFGPLPCRPA
jgi:cytochrome b pre-mRNA-processing protein 3